MGHQVSSVYATHLISQGTILLNDGNRMPMISFDTIEKIDKADQVVKPAVIEAIEAGYRQIDTAPIYENEEYIGEAIIDVINRGIVRREELWITSKLQTDLGTREGVLESLQAALKRFKLDYVDLYLIQTPDNIMQFVGNSFVNPTQTGINLQTTLNLPEYDILDIWKGMEDVKKLNLTRSIGVANFNSTHINRILANSETIPAANEIEVNPMYANLELVAYCQSLNITVLSYAPFGFMVPRPFSLYPVETSFQEPILVQLALKYGKIPSQIVLRYLIDRGTVPIPRSNNGTHIHTNIDVFDFQLTPDEIYSINELNRNVKVYIFEGESFDAILAYYGFEMEKIN
ncbi:aldo-keto reductase AKR2E4-like [Melitaea cinxia]|uniref:aldo-keto reductase AKR2E4-like n=1 Tax=Melitaea cinxia TaxID=113334 RepID=UPI001E26EECA|nr:aldo-keto reductase AKR2E4-like [Melitaea cinxia]